MYKSETTKKEVSIPKGIFLAGFLTSSATLAIFVNPPYETKISPAVANSSLGVPLTNVRKWDLGVTQTDADHYFQLV